VVLEFLGRVLLTEGRDFVEVHLQVMRHFLGELILGGRGGGNHEQCKKAEHGWTESNKLD